VSNGQPLGDQSQLSEPRANAADLTSHPRRDRLRRHASGEELAQPRFILGRPTSVGLRMLAPDLVKPVGRPRRLAPVRQDLGRFLVGDVHLDRCPSVEVCDHDARSRAAREHLA
jgi:hypothetical protein